MTIHTNFIWFHHSLSVSQLRHSARTKFELKFLLLIVSSLVLNTSKVKKVSWLSSYCTCNIIFFSTNLTWRDVQHIIANSARAAPGGVFLERGEWQQNKAGFYFSKYYGFGLMDAGRMVNLAKNWTQVPRQRKCKIEGSERYTQGFILHSFWLCLHGRPHEIFESYRTYR